MQQLVDHRVHQAHRVGAHRGAHQRIVEPAERAERRRRPQVAVQPARLEPRRLRFRQLHVEESLVRHAADDREPPAVAAQLVALGGREHHHQRVAVQPRKLGEALTGVQPHRVGGEGARLQHQAQAVAQRRRRARIGDDIGDVSPPRENSSLLPRRANQIATGAGGEPGEQNAEHDPEQGAPDAARPASGGRRRREGRRHQPPPLVRRARSVAHAARQGVSGRRRIVTCASSSGAKLVPVAGENWMVARGVAPVFSS